MLLAIDFTNLHEILQALYQDMMPLCEKLTGVAKGIAGLGALFYVAAKVWQAIARAEPIDVYPLLRPGEGLPRDARITDLRHEPVPGAEGGSGERGVPA